MNSYPSIFNDVIGPVMRGPSSSHCAASLRIGRICRDLMDGMLDNVLVEYDTNGSLATTHKGQGSDMGLFSGLLGWQANDERLIEYIKGVDEAGIDIKIKIHDYGATHPNTYKLTLTNSVETHELTALSTGGGMIEIINIDGADVSMAGDYFVTLIYHSSASNIVEYINNSDISYDELGIHTGSHTFISLKTQDFLPDEIISNLQDMDEVIKVKKLSPVLPIMAQKDLSVPFITVDEMLDYNVGKNLKLWELAVHYEAERGNISPSEVRNRMHDIVDIMQSSITNGLNGTEYDDRIMGGQSLKFRKQKDNNNLIEGDVLNNSVMFTSAIMEVKSSMGVIVAAPTAGSCGALPGSIIGIGITLGLSKESMVNAMLAAGLIGVFITAHATFAAEVGGCMAECGAASGMAAAGAVTLKNGTLHQSLSAASMALQSSLGLVCDMVADRVEAPCLSRNVMAASTAISCANMALADYDQVIPLDEVIDTMKKVGDAIPNTLRCTGLGGLAVTKTAKEIEARLAENEKDSDKNEHGSSYKIC